MAIFDGVLLCTDLDGTFLHNARASEENCRAVRFFQENGGKFTVATGRSHAFVHSFENYTPNAPLIVSNGTMILDNLTRRPLDICEMPAYTCDILDELYEEGLLNDVFLYDLDNGGTEVTDHRYWNPSLGTAPGKFFSKTARPWLKMLLQAKNPADSIALMELIRTRYPGMFETSRSYEIGMELHAPGSGKGPCAEKLRKLLGGIDLLVGAGDYENDISLIKSADIGYAVANAQPDVLAAADRITVDCQEHAIAQIIEDIRRERT